MAMLKYKDMKKNVIVFFTVWLQERKRNSEAILALQQVAEKLYGKVKTFM